MMQGSLSTRLRVLRAERGLSLREASSLTGVRPGTLSELERGLRHPQDLTLAKIAAAYGVSVEELLDLEEEPRGNEAGEPVLSGKAEVPEEETGFTDAQLLYKLFDPTVERTPSEAQAARERFLQYNRVAIVISALAELVDHAELVLRRGMFDLQEIESLEEVASGQYFIHKRYARAEVLERGTSEQNATLKRQETRMDEALSGLREAYLARFEQARREVDWDPKKLARLEDRHRTHEERIKRTA